MMFTIPIREGGVVARFIIMCLSKQNRYLPITDRDPIQSNPVVPSVDGGPILSKEPRAKAQVGSVSIVPSEHHHHHHHHQQFRHSGLCFEVMVSCFFSVVCAEKSDFRHMCWSFVRAPLEVVVVVQISSVQFGKREWEGK